MSFTLNIETGNEAMRSADDVADALRTLADRITSPDYARGNVRDRNGNTVGEYALDLSPDYHDDHYYTTEELEALPVLSVGQADDLHIDTGAVRVWLSRCGVEDGEPFDNKVTVETLSRDGRWVEYRVYSGDMGAETVFPY
jgi:hypothetical protein